MDEALAREPSWLCGNDSPLGLLEGGIGVEERSRFCASFVFGSLIMTISRNI